MFSYLTEILYKVRFGELFLAKLKDWCIDSFLGSAAWPGGGGEALLTSAGTGDCIGLSQLISMYSRGRDLHGLFLLFLGAH